MRVALTFCGMVFLGLVELGLTVELLFLTPHGGLSSSAALNVAIGLAAAGVPVLHVIAIARKHPTLEVVSALLWSIGLLCGLAFARPGVASPLLTIAGGCLVLGGWSLAQRRAVSRG